MNLPNSFCFTVFLGITLSVVNLPDILTFKPVNIVGIVLWIFIFLFLITTPEKSVLLTVTRFLVIINAFLIIVNIIFLNFVLFVFKAINLDRIVLSW